MSKNRILMVFDNGEQRELIKEKIDEEFRDEVSVEEVRSEKALDQLGKKRYDLLIISLHKSPLSSEEQPGLAFLQSVRQQGKEFPAILFLDYVNADTMKELRGIPECKYILEGEDLESTFIRLCTEALGKGEGKVSEQEKRLDVEIFLDLSKGQGLAVFSGVGIIFQWPNVALKIDTEKLDKLKEKSERVEKHDDWLLDLKEIGEELYEHIFVHNPKFFEYFYEKKGEVGGLANIRLRFGVDEKTHPILLEALYARAELSSDYWMLHAPIYRTVKDIPGMQYPLYQDRQTLEGKINCLIIEGKTSGLWKEGDKLGGELEELKHVTTECDKIQECLTANHTKFRIDQIKRIRNEDVPSEKSFKEYLWDELEKDGKENRFWHIVHYAGHSHYDRNTRKAFVFFPGRDPDPVDVDQFAKELRKVSPRFIYLSSCRSSEQDFVYALAACNIPAVVGFRWPIDDPMAEKFTEKFYKHLFERRLLESAFLEARRNMYKEHASNKIWAAPMLIMQLQV